MIELHHTVVAHIAMSGANWPEDKTCLTELELASHLVAMLSLIRASEHIGNPLLFDFDNPILFIDEVVGCRGVQKARDYAWVFYP